MDIILKKILSVIGIISECKDGSFEHDVSLLRIFHFKASSSVMLSECNECEHPRTLVRLLRQLCMRSFLRRGHTSCQDSRGLPHYCTEIFTSVASNLLRMTEKNGKNIYFSMMILILFFFFTAPCQAYVEEVGGNRTQIAAGDQNTAMYRLQARSTISLKHLKKIDEMMARSPEAGDGSAQNVAEVSQIIQAQENAAIRDQLEKMKSAELLLQNKSDLRRRQNDVAPQTISSLSASEIHDETVAAELRQFLQGSNK